MKTGSEENDKMGLNELWLGWKLRSEEQEVLPLGWGGGQVAPPCGSW